MNENDAGSVTPFFSTEFGVNFQTTKFEFI